MQCKLYDEEKCVTIDLEKDLSNVHDETIRQLLYEGKNWSQLWMTFGQKKNNFDSNFMSISQYAMNHSIKELTKE